MPEPISAPDILREAIKAGALPADVEVSRQGEACWTRDGLELTAWAAKNHEEKELGFAVPLLRLTSLRQDGGLRPRARRVPLPAFPGLRAFPSLSLSFSDLPGVQADRRIWTWTWTALPMSCMG